MSEYWHNKVQLLEQELAQTCKCRFDHMGNPKHVCDYHKYVGEKTVQAIKSFEQSGAHYENDWTMKELKKYLYRLGVK